MKIDYHLLLDQEPEFQTFFAEATDGISMIVNDDMIHLVHDFYLDGLCTHKVRMILEFIKVLGTGYARE